MAYPSLVVSVRVPSSNLRHAARLRAFERLVPFGVRRKKKQGTFLCVSANKHTHTKENYRCRGAPVLSSPRMQSLAQLSGRRGGEALLRALNMDKCMRQTGAKRVALNAPQGHDDSRQREEPKVTKRRKEDPVGSTSAAENPYHQLRLDATAHLNEWCKEEITPIYHKFQREKRRHAPRAKPERATGTRSPPVPPRARSGCPIPSVTGDCTGLCRTN